MSDRSGRVRYEVIPGAPRAHRFTVTCTLAEPDPDGQLWSLPAWIPGSYLIRDFARNLSAVRAEAEDGPLALERLDKQTWRCAPCAGPLRLTYEVQAFDPSVRAAYLDHRRGFFNGTSMFLRPHGLEETPCELHLAPPADVEGNWRAVTTLAAVETDAAGFGVYEAAGYHRLVDHPVALGPAVEQVAFRAGDVPHAFVLLGDVVCDRDRLAADLAAVCQAQIDFFGELPVTQYSFLAQVGGDGYGGLEHRDCCVLNVPRHALPAPGEQRREAYLNLLGLCSHEYFHLWNVKRIQPRAVADSDLSAEAHFADLWAYEGVTSYCDDLALVRAGVLPPRGYLDRLARAATRLQRTPGRHRQSLAESSFDAWTKFYRPDAHSPNTVVSYYNKGALVSLCLDLHLRRETGGRVTLETVMRGAWHDYGRHGRPMPEHGLERVAREVSGLDLDDFFQRYVHGTEDPPLAEALAAVGVRAELHPADDPDQAAQSALGLRLASGYPARVQHVLEGGPAQAAGLCPGDRLVALGGLAVEADNLAARLRPHEAGSTVPLHVLRDDELLSLELNVAPPPADTWRLTLEQAVDADTLTRRRAWLGAS